MRIHALTAMIALSLCGWPSAPAAARDYHVSLLGVGQVVADPEYDTLSADDGLALFNLELGLELPELLEGLGLELTYGTGEQQSRLFAGDDPWLKTRLQLHEVLLGVVYRYPLTSWLNASARVGASLDFAKLSLRSQGEALLSDWDLARLGGYGLLGLELAMPRGLWGKWLTGVEGDPTEGFTIGLRLEAGWSLRQPMRYGDMVGDAGGRQAIEVQGAELGAVSLDGFLFRAGAYVVF